MNRRAIFWLWLPLALSFTFMMLEGPTVQAAIARLPEPALNLAAFGLVLGISLIIESPVIMLVSTAIALATNAQAYRALLRFVTGLNLVLTLVTAIVAWTPLFDVIAGGVLGMPAPIVEAGRPAFRIMLLWTAAIGWRRFYQGILVRFGQTRRVSFGTALRLLASAVVAVMLVITDSVSGASAGAWVLMAGVAVECVAIFLMARGCVRGELLAQAPSGEPPLTLGQILRFHTPLAATSLLTLAAQPLTAAALARLAMPRETLAAWPVVFSTLLVMRGWGLALQETTIAQAKDPRALAPLRGFTMIVAGVTMLATAGLALTPLIDLYLGTVIGLAPELRGLVRTGVLICLLLPPLTALSSWLRGLLVASGATDNVYWGMLINLVTNCVVLGLGIVLSLPGVPVAAFGLTLAMLTEYAFLYTRTARLRRSDREAPVPGRSRPWRRPSAKPSIQHLD